MKLDRRSFFQALMIAAPGAIELSAEMKQSTPERMVVCWGGWRTSQENNRLVGWFTAHLPIFVCDPRIPPHPYQNPPHQHFVSMVNSSKAYPDYLTPVAGYNPGAHFDICNSICLEDEDIKAMQALSHANRDEIFDQMFAKEKTCAAERLINYLQELVPYEPVS